VLLGRQDDARLSVIVPIVDLTSVLSCMWYVAVPRAACQYPCRHAMFVSVALLGQLECVL
jgi:hypothetical protein